MSKIQDELRKIPSVLIKSSDEKKHYKAIIGRLETSHTEAEYTLNDQDAIVQLAKALSYQQILDDEISKNGFSIERNGAKGIVVVANPAVRARAENVTTIRHLLKTLQLDSSERKRMGVETKERIDSRDKYKMKAVDA